MTSKIKIVKSPEHTTDAHITNIGTFTTITSRKNAKFAFALVKHSFEKGNRDLVKIDKLAFLIYLHHYPK